MTVINHLNLYYSKASVKKIKNGNADIQMCRPVLIEPQSTVMVCLRLKKQSTDF